MQAIGQGASEKMTSEAAIAVAQAGAPAPFTEPWAHVHEAAPGDLVTVTPTDTGFDPVEGALVISRTNEVEIRRSDPRAGEVVVHFPRVRFQLKKRDPQGVVN